MSLRDLREKRKKLAEEANAVLAVATKEGRATSPEENAKFDAILADVDALKATIERGERAEDEARSYVPDSQRGRETASDRRDEQPEQSVRDAAFRKWMTRGARSLSEIETRALGPQQDEGGTSVTLRFPTPEERAAIREGRAQTVTTTAGGYLIAPEFSYRVEKSMLWFGTMLNEAEIIDTSTGAALTWPTYDDTSNVGAILAINTGVSNQDVTFSQMSLGAFKYSSKQVLIPVELMQDSAFDMNALVADVLGERLGRILNTHFTTGAGTTVPYGVVTQAGTGKTGATGQTTSVTYDDIVDLVYSLDKAYRQKAKFMLNDATIKALRKLKDGNGLPLWTAGGPTSGEPDSLFGYPVVPNNDVAVMGTSAKSIVFGDLTKYKVRRVKDVTLLRLNERYADAHQVGFLAFARFDGNLLDSGTDPVKLYVNSAS
jgi:HK97 family phage major capsid protein